MEVTGRLLMVDGMTKLPEAFGLEPVMVMVFWEVENNNSAFRDAGRMSSSARIPRVAILSFFIEMFWSPSKGLLPRLKMSRFFRFFV